MTRSLFFPESGPFLRGAVSVSEEDRKSPRDSTFIEPNLSQIGSFPQVWYHYRIRGWIEAAPFHPLMLCAKRKSDGQIVTAYLESKSNAPFLCPECGDPIILKTGKVRVNYFAHENLLACRYGAGESEAHRKCKMEIYEALLRERGVHNVALERPLASVRPDVSAYINNVPVAIEVQISSLSLETITHRTIEYARKGIYVIWLLQWTPKLDGHRYTPRLWEKWIHAAYFGRVYYWIKGLLVVCYHFDPNFKSVRQKTWYSEQGKKMTSGGYSRRSKRYRTAIRGQTLNLATDFVPKQRDWWEGNGLKVPAAKIFMHRHEHSRASANDRLK